MELKLEQLAPSLQKQLYPVYLIASDEHLLLEESAQLIIQAAHKAGHTEKERLVVEKGFNWQHLLDANSSMSLFGDKKIIDLRIPNGKPEAEGSKVLQAYLDNASPDNILLIRCPQLNKASQNSKWVKAIKAAGAFCIIWKVKPQQMPMWVKQRAANFQLQLDREASQMLADRVEGNLLAAHQEIEKLSLLFPPNSQLGVKQIMQTVATNSRYDVFNMIEQALLGHGAKALAMLRGLREEKLDLTVIAWAIRNEMNALQAVYSLSQSQNRAMAYKQLGTWKSKQTPYNKALDRMVQADFKESVQQLAQMDLAIKGQVSDSADKLCESLILKIAGIKIPV